MGMPGMSAGVAPAFGVWTITCANEVAAIKVAIVVSAKILVFTALSFFLSLMFLGDFIYQAEFVPIRVSMPD
jgi:hypothetical protein